MTHNIITETEQATVVAEYTPDERRSEDYQSEAGLEREFVQLLQSQGYERLTIRDETALVINLRKQLELLNNYTFTDTEWERLPIC